MSTPYNLGLWQTSPPTRPTPTALSRTEIVATAITLADTDGAEAVSMRKVGAALGVGAMRLYTHVPTKADLLALMVEHVYGEIATRLAAETPAAGWRARLQQIGQAFRTAAFQHGWFVDLLTGRPALGPNALIVLEAMAAGVESAPGRHTAASTRLALSIVNAFLIGATRTDVLEHRLEVGSVGGELWQREAEAYLRQVFTTGHFPTLEHLAIEAVQASSDAEFRDGLSIVLDGVGQAFRGRGSHSTAPAEGDAGSE